MSDEPTTAEAMGAKGGKAAAARMTPEQRAERAKKAAEGRWAADPRGNAIPRATHGSPDRPLMIGDVALPCYVLSDGRRVITNQGLQIGLKLAKSGGQQRTAALVASLERKGIDCKDLLDSITNPIQFRPVSGGRAYGYEGTILADLCDAILVARERGLLNYQQLELAAQCEVLVRAFARVGIVALIDAATGYEKVRDRDALQAILDRYLRRGFAAWAKRFPDEFYKEMFRLKGWKWDMRNPAGGPRCVAQITVDLTYARMESGLVTELETRNPVHANGRRKAAHHQWLTDDIGHPALERHLIPVIALMRACPDRSWDQYRRMLDRAFPRKGHSIQLDFGDLLPDSDDERRPPLAVS